MKHAVKFTVSVPGRVFKDLEALRARAGVSRSELVREALRRLGPAASELFAGVKATRAEIREEPARYSLPAGPLREITDADERRRRALAAAGRFHSGLTDLSTGHDAYLEDDYAAAGRGPKRKP